MEDEQAQDYEPATRVLSHGPKLDYSRNEIQSKVPQSTANLHNYMDPNREIVYIPPLSGKNSAGMPLNFEKFFSGSNGRVDDEARQGGAASSIPSRINSRAGSNFISPSIVGLKPQQSMQALDTTQMVTKLAEGGGAATGKGFGGTLV